MRFNTNLLEKQQGHHVIQEHEIENSQPRKEVGLTCNGKIEMKLCTHKLENQ